MKKCIFLVIVCVALALNFSACSMVVCNNIYTGNLNIVEQNGETYIKSIHSQVYSIDLESKTFSLADDGETGEPTFGPSDPNVFKCYCFPGKYRYTIPKGYDSVASHVERCETGNEKSVVDASGYVQNGLLVGFVQIYEKTRGVYGNYSIEEIDRSIVFSYDAQTDEFTVEHTIDGVVIVALHDDTVIYWKDKAYYKYDLQTKVEKHLIDDKAYDTGLSQLSSSGVYYNSEICIIHLSERKMAGKYIDYMYVYDWSQGDLVELNQESE